MEYYWTVAKGLCEDWFKEDISISYSKVNVPTNIRTLKGLATCRR